MPLLQRQPDGRIDAKLSLIGIGCSRVGSLLNATSLSEIKRTLSTAYDAGVNVFDTANIYGQGDSERTLGALFGKRPDVFIVTKGGMSFSRKALLMSKLKPVLRPLVQILHASGGASASRAKEIRKDFSRAGLMASLEGSLKRLRRDRIDCYLLHDPDTAAIGNAEVWETLRLAKQQGKIRYCGVSVGTIAEIEAALEAPLCDAVEAPLDILLKMRGNDGYRRLVERGTALFVREVLRRSGEVQPLPIGAALGPARELPGIASIIVGISRSDHLAQLLGAL